MDFFDRRHDPHDPVVSETVVPPVDVYETASRVVVILEIAGADPDSLRVMKAGTELTISGSREEHPHSEKIRLYHMEIAYGRFERRVVLPEGLASEAAYAIYEHGILRIEFDRVEEEPPAGRIPVTSR